jgi:hypothetical protein
MIRFLYHLFLPLVFLWESALGAEKIDFSAQIRPILSQNCFHCHGPDDHARKAKLRLDLAEEATQKRDDGSIAIKPGDPTNSVALSRMQSHDPEEMMPPPQASPPLKAGDIELIKQWIAEGAEYTGHWAFTKPARPAVPDTKSTWPRQAFDHFVLEKLNAASLIPSPPAEPSTLARRAALDLTGLPPSPELLQKFLLSPGPEAYGNYVDGLLASPAYGERWARMWMDLARYADSAGYGSDPLRLNIWPYRDWVIKAFNDNMPYDAFTRAQLAGDLIPNTSSEQLVATAFHRNTMTNTEGGTDDEEWRVAAVKDRTHVTFQVWMGLTMGCAQCHSHKFDPISHQEFYQTFAIFNQTSDHDSADESPTQAMPNPAEKQHVDRIQAEIQSIKHTIENGNPELIAEQAEWEKQVRREITWQPVCVVNLSTAGRPAWEKQPDGSVLVRSGVATKATYDLQATTPLQGITALRLEALPDDTLPHRGPGHSAAGNAVLSELKLGARPSRATSPAARYVRVEAPGKARFLHVAEVEVMSAGKNVARQGKASQVSTDFGGEAARGIDGNTDGTYTANSVTHTATADSPWWEVDLGREFPLEQIVLWNRTDPSTVNRLPPFKISALNEERHQVWQHESTEAPNPKLTVDVSDARPAVPLTNATATYSQTGWEVSKAIDGDNKTGWGFAPRNGEVHTAVFELRNPLDFPGTVETQLDISLSQDFGDDHTLGKFRLSVTNASLPVPALSGHVRSIISKAPDQRSDAEKSLLRDLFRPASKGIRKLEEILVSKQKELSEIKPLGVPVMVELPKDKQRRTHLLNKGNFLDPGPEVSAAVPTAFGPWPDGAPQNRLGLTDWLFSAENPLTARVAANRFWSQLFGIGLVETEEDFGTQGTLPSHPQLLDWLACELREKNWDMKAFLKMIVTSATYCQSSQVSPQLLEKDGSARLLSRYPRRRLDAEQVRDQALAVSGLLSGKVGGPSVYPPQPDGLWKAAFNGQRTYDTSKGEDRYRRGLYTIWRRSVPYPSMATFDAPSRESCTIRRIPTNTPLQAYVTLNDPVYVEAAQALARRIMKEGGADITTRLAFAYRLTVAREADPQTLEALEKLYHNSLAVFQKDSGAAMQFATMPLGELPADIPAPEAAAWTAVANALLNLDAVLMKS